MRSTKRLRFSLSVLLVVFGLGPITLASPYSKGDPQLKSAGVLAFAPDGVLLIADQKSAAVVAVKTGDTTANAASASIALDDLAGKCAAVLGTKAEEIIINDLAVNPGSGRAYVSVARGRGPDAAAAVLRVSAGGKIELVDLSQCEFLRAELPDAPPDGERGQGRRRRNPRMMSITDLAYVDGSVLVAGLSNEEFTSTLRSIPFPFKDVAKGSKVRIYHGAHGKYETNSPVRTFLPMDIGGKPHLLAAYQCTPLVKLPLADIKPGAEINGVTIAELGNRNRPLDMVTYEKDGKRFVLIANNSRGVMKIEAKILGPAGAIKEERVRGTSGVEYETLADWKGVEQLDLLDGKHALVVQENEGKRNLVTLALP